MSTFCFFHGAALKAGKHCFVVLNSNCEYNCLAFKRYAQESEKCFVLSGVAVAMLKVKYQRVKDHNTSVSSCK